MKTSTLLKSTLLAAVLAGVAGGSLLAQDATPLPGPRPPSDHAGPHHPPNPLMDALDTNHDGILSADEIANAAASLKKLDKNGDGQLTEDELRPAHPPGGPGGLPPHGHHGPGGDTGAVTPEQQHGEFDARPLPPELPAGPAFAAGPADPAEAVPHAPAAARARKPARLADDPVVTRLDPSATAAP